MQPPVLYNLQLTEQGNYFTLDCENTGGVAMRICFSAHVNYFVAVQILISIGSLEASAQLNVQTQVELANAPFTVRPLRRELESPERRGSCVAQHGRCLSKDELTTIVRNNSRQNPRFQTPSEEPGLVAELMDPTVNPRRKQTLVQIKALPVNIKPGEAKKPPTQPSSLILIFQSLPGWQSNAPQSTPGQDSGVITFGGGFQLAGQGARALDIFAVKGGATSSRYDPLNLLNRDQTTASAQYQFFLNAYDRNGNWFDAWAGTDMPGGTVTFDSLTVGIQDSRAFAPTFERQIAEFVTPSVTFSRDNIPLSQATCFRPAQTRESFCYYLDLAATLAHTIASPSFLNNSSATLSATAGYRVPDTFLTLAMAGSVSGKTYHNAVGGREDVFLQFGPRIGYAPNQHVNLNLAASYNENFSTLGPARWSGWIIQPTLSVSLYPDIFAK
jgi:hypothetical protein